MTVIDFKTKKIESEPHYSGYAQCIGCGHGKDDKWVAVAPVGTVELECPACGSMRGQYRYPFGPGDPDSQIYRCVCESELFNFVQKSGSVEILCTGCGRCVDMDSVFPK